MSIKAAGDNTDSDECNAYMDVYRALSYASLGNKESAIYTLNKLLEQNIDDGALWHCIARAYSILGYRAETYDCLNKALTEHAGPSERELMHDLHFEGYTIPSVLTKYNVS